jgi:hypothetical protein
MDGLVNFVLFHIPVRVQVIHYVLVLPQLIAQFVSVRDKYNYRPPPPMY